MAAREVPWAAADTEEVTGVVMAVAAAGSCPDSLVGCSARPPAAGCTIALCEATPANMGAAHRRTALGAPTILLRRLPHRMRDAISITPVVTTTGAMPKAAVMQGAEAETSAGETSTAEIRAVVVVTCVAVVVVISVAVAGTSAVAAETLAAVAVIFERLPNG